MGHFIKLDKNKYKLIADLGYRGKRRIRKTRTVEAKNDKEAQRLLILFEDEMKKDKDVHFTNIDNITLGQFYPKWRDNQAKQFYAPKTFQNYCSYIENRILPMFGDFKIKDIKKVDVVFFIADLSKNGRRTDNKRSNGPDGKLSASSIRNIHKAFSNLMNTACEWNLISENPCLGVKLPKIITPEGRAYSENEVALLLERLQQRAKPLKRLLVQFAIVSGARLGEIAALELKHLDVENNTVLIEQTITTVISKNKEERQFLKETKGKKKRRVSIPHYVMEDLILLGKVKQSQLDELGDAREWKEHTFLFSSDYGKPYNVSSLSSWWKNFLRKNPDLTQIRFHELRHTSASLLIHAGEHPKVIQGRLGHSDIKMTMNTYGHLLPESDQRASSYFNRFFEKED
ncbi:tyrosine-type recombinase/integrase [Lysinibacillus sp. KU-BSD001]|uniref:site-specific integrase n=1 Tax=Lysinibacillus sp. KU-BSD001 TaxID=3141328 RepID=UPI0036E845BC